MKLFLNILGWISFLLGVIGVFMPILPTTPFVILASYLFSKSSPRFHKWLLELKYFGPMIKDWEDHGTIHKKAKITAVTLLICIFIAYALLSQYDFWVKSTIFFIFTLVILFIVSRPSSPNNLQLKIKD